MRRICLVVLALLLVAASAHAETGARGRRILTRTLSAHGGAARLRALESIQRTVRIRFAVGTSAIELSAVVTTTPDRRRDEIVGPTGARVEVITPEGGWSRAGEGPPSPMPAERAELALARHRLSLDWLAHRARERGTTITALPRQSVDGKRYDAVRVRDAEGRATVLLIDPRTRLVFEQSFEASLPSDALTIRYHDYRRVGRLRFPFADREVYGNNEGVVETWTEALVVNVPLPDDVFER